MIQITKRTLLYGLILFIMTIALVFLIHDASTVVGVITFISWAILYSLVTFLFLSTEDQSKARGNLKFSYGLVGIIAVIPVVVITDILVNLGTRDSIGDKMWAIPSIVLIVALNYFLQRGRLKGYRKQEVFK
jgi:Na+/H+-translocating membrane pyrophosphatase